MGTRERFTPGTDFNVEPITDDEYRQAGLTVLDALPETEDDSALTEHYLTILAALGFDQQ